MKPRTGGSLRSYRATIAAVLVFGWGIPETVSAEPANEIDDTIAVAMDDADQGRCDEALERLVEVDGLESRARLLAGQCRVRAGLYPEALADLDRARDGRDLNAEQVGDVELYRAIALYHLERFTEAAAALDKADGRTGEDAEFDLYSGLIALRNGDHDRAAPALESAARLSPERTEPVASYYAGLAWLGASERTKARRAFERVIEIDADGPWGQEAAKHLESTELFPYYVRGGVGIEYDDNVILQGGVTQFVEPGSNFTDDGKKDWRGVWHVDSGVQLFNVGDWSGGLAGGYSGNAQFDLTDFDTHYPRIGAYLANRIDSHTTAQARYQFGFAWIGGDSFLRTNSAELGLSHVWQKAGATIVLADVTWNDFRFTTDDVQDGPGPPPGGACVPALGLPCGPSGVNESRERERDGIGFSSGLEHRYRFDIPNGMDEILEQVELIGGYRFRYYNSEGDEWEHFAHIVSTRIEVELPLDFSVSTRVSLEYRDFANPSTYPDSGVIDEEYSLSNADREEYEVVFEAEIEKDLNENFSVSARWTYIDNESNRRVYDYTRNIVGGYVNFRFD
jgi:tetratricopeptide (TPR) repeat protein